MKFWVLVGEKHIQKVFAELDESYVWTSEYPMITGVLNTSMGPVLQEMKSHGYIPIPEMFIMHRLNNILKDFNMEVTPLVPFVISDEAP